MKSLATTLLFSALLCGQTPPTSGVVPGTPAPPVQAPPTVAAPVTPETVVAEVAGKKWTAAEVDKLFAGLPAQMQQSAHMQPARALTQILMLQHMAEEAEKAGLDKRAPWKDTLEFQRMTILYQAEINDYKDKIQISPEDQDKTYKAN